MQRGYLLQIVPLPFIELSEGSNKPVDKSCIPQVSKSIVRRNIICEAEDLRQHGLDVCKLILGLDRLVLGPDGEHLS